MDPNATLDLIEQHWKACNFTEAYECAMDLREWLDNGGLYPSGIPLNSVDEWLSFVITEVPNSVWEADPGV